MTARRPPSEHPVAAPPAPSAVPHVRTSRHPVAHFFDRMAGSFTHASGSPPAFALALLTVIVWACTGPIFRFSETWQLVINTGTTIVTFLMVFLIQHAQNKDSVALHLKLNELIAAQREASNSLIAVEDLDEEELLLVRRFYQRLAELDVAEGGVSGSHAPHRIPEAHARKRRPQASARNTPAEALLHESRERAGNTVAKSTPDPGR